MGLLDKLSRKKTDARRPKTSLIAKGLAKTRAILGADIKDLVRGRQTLDAALLEELETRLLMADVGIESTETILQQLRDQTGLGATVDADTLLDRLQGIMVSLLESVSTTTVNRDRKPHSILVVGVNGSGKTTSIGKLAHRYRQAGQSVMLAAGDTFRAAAIEQLQAWAERNNVPIVSQAGGSDPAAVVFDGLQSAQSRQIDILLADTAGRLHTQGGLMDELKKTKRVMHKLDPEAPDEILLVIDAGIGQNALQQAKQFHEAVGVTGLVLTKLDGTAKGGIVFAIQQQLKIPVQYIGVGEGLEDLQPFEAQAFARALLSQG